MGEANTFIPIALSRYLPRHVLSGGKFAYPSARHFEGVAMMVDIAGFTELTETFALQGVAGAERLSAILDLYFGRMTAIAIEYGGDVLDFAGDAIRVIWEYDTSPHATGLLAVQCGLKLQRGLPEIIAETGVQMCQRISLAEGKLTHLTVGGIGGKWYSLTVGGPVAESAAANHEGGADEVVVCASLWEKVQGHLEARRLLGNGAAITKGCHPALMFVAQTPDLAPSKDLLEAFLDRHFLERVRVDCDRWFAEFRNISTLFIGLSRVDCASDEALSHLQSAVECTQSIHARFGGALTELSADDKGLTLLSVFGLPLMAHEDDAVRAVAAGQSLVDALHERGIAVSIGITTGQALYADRGGSERRHAGLTGGVVNRAARLMTAAHDDILCDQATRDAAAHGFQFDACGPVAAKGINEVLAVWRPRAPESDRHFFTGVSVGREPEFDQLSRALDHVIAGNGDAIALCAEAGLGKTRLIADIAAHARERGVLVIWGAGFALESMSVYHVWRHILAQLLCGTSRFNPAIARHVAASLVGNDECLVSWLALLNDILPFAFDDTQLTREMVGHARADGVRKLVTAIISRSSLDTPLLLIADDLHWFDGASAALLLELTIARPPGLLLLSATRPLDSSSALEAHRVVRESCRRVLLSALTPNALGVLIANRLGAKEVTHELLDFVVARSEGNPLYAEEVVSALHASGYLEVTDGIGELVAGAASEAKVRLPEGLRGIIVSRGDTLGGAEQLLLKIAAVVGPEFSLKMLRDLFPDGQGKANLIALVQGLERDDVVYPVADDRYRFKHVLLQDAVYELLPYRLRQELHRDIAGWIELNESHDLEPHFAALASHWERALKFSSAVAYLEKSAEHSLKHYATRDAIRQAELALRLAREHGLSPDPQREMRFETILGEAYSESFQYDAAKYHFSRALVCAGRPVPRYVFTMALDVTWQLAQQLSARAGLARSRSADPLLPRISQIHEKLSEIAYFNSGKLSILHATLTSLNLAERSGSVSEAVKGLAAMAIGFAGAGQRWLSQVYNRRSLALAKEQGGIDDIAYATVVSGVYWAADAHWERAIECLTHSASLYARLGAIERWQQSIGGLCAVALARGQLGEAKAWLDQLRPARHDMPAQIAAYLHGFDSCLALTQGDQLQERVTCLRKVLGARELPQFDRIFCQGLLAISYWRLGEHARAVESAQSALNDLSAGMPVAWYITEGIAGIAQTLIDASRCGMASRKDAQHACRILTRYARATRPAAPRAALIAGRMAAARNDKPCALACWRRGLAMARALGTGYDEALLLYELGNQSPLGSSERTELLEQARVQHERIGAPFVTT
ncbi:AAA family ATPase [Paraburkholderia youngii]|uniref:Adenylate cyclase n=1 Tax=Paraburkholderia youngii TaxID=2782701 RepID=A0A7W8L4Z7_9BURK|nr:adenylate/guanylate cyclase domain-containing protein [Paraburkholderia youngii]MBB5399099.1 adenylate cyclase [Paraburkholderia youngii]